MANEGNEQDKGPKSYLDGEHYHGDFGVADMTYGDYLKLDKVLDGQPEHPTSHDEMLFVVIHQAKELWMKLMIHELEGALPYIRRGELRPAFKMLARVKRCQDQLIGSWSVLNTMTPTEYTRFRHELGRASGFQSFQYRAIEFFFGNKQRGMLAPHRARPAIHQRLTDILERPSLYDEVVMLLARRGFQLDHAVLDRDWSKVREPNASVEAAWLAIYKEPESHWDLYELAEDLVDIDDQFQTWRFRHANTVERVIGNKTGTGGTSGVQYLRRAVEVRLFPELWSVRTQL
ncbi:MAG: tryptophan 2,3-dioxygenase [Deltaproteobacteria bacterium]|nr:tryptophan 2,3-dioxygenase [Deltaproteobacteria bacterium]